MNQGIDPAEMFAVVCEDIVRDPSPLQAQLFDLVFVRAGGLFGLVHV